MRRSTRGTSVAAIAVAACLALVAPLSGAANAAVVTAAADPSPTATARPGDKPKPTPTPKPGATPKPKPSKPHPATGKPYPHAKAVKQARAVMERRAEAVEQVNAAREAVAQRAAQAEHVAEVATEEFLGAKWRLQEARKEARKAERKAARARARVERQRAGIAALVTQSYQNGSSLHGLTTFMTGGQPNEIMQRDGVAQSAGQSLKLRYDAFAALSRAAVEADEKARAARKKARALARETKTARENAAVATEAAQNARARISGTEARLRERYAEAEQEFRELKRAREQALELLADDDPENDPGKELPPPPPPEPEPSPTIHHGIADDTSLLIPKVYPGPVPKAPKYKPRKAARAIAFAKEQLGDMYLWAATGPDRWDCSGLTMGAWKKGGVALPHYSEAQYLTSVPISAADLKPGDLVFWQGAQLRIHHVALYIGDGKILHAPATGQPVQIVKMADFLPPDYFARPRY